MTSATFFSRLSNLFLLVHLLLQVSLLTASPTSPALLFPDELSLSKRAGGSKIPSEYESRINKGEFVRALMPLDNAEAAEKDHGFSVVSKFQDPKDATRWGWTVDTAWYPYRKDLEPLHTDLLWEAFEDPTLPVNQEKSGVYYHLHDKEFKEPYGEEGWPTGAFYSNVINPSAGAFMFDENISPRQIFKQTGVGTIPALNRLSDIAFLQWLEACQHEKTDPRDLRVIFQAHVTYKPTFETVVDALKELGLKSVPGRSVIL
ncbi:hypothetical protein LY78DRAFT_749323, partial [Colletotrichum sublineola]